MIRALLAGRARSLAAGRSASRAARPSLDLRRRGAARPAAAIVRARLDFSGAPWAVPHGRLEHEGDERVVLCIDDTDELDGVSRAAIEDLLVADGLERFLLIATCKKVPEAWFLAQCTSGLCSGSRTSDAAQMLGAAPAASGRSQPRRDRAPVRSTLPLALGASSVDQAPPPRSRRLSSGGCETCPPHRRALARSRGDWRWAVEFVSAVLQRADDLAGRSIRSSLWVRRGRRAGVRLARLCSAQARDRAGPPAALVEVHRARGTRAHRIEPTSPSVVHITPSVAARLRRVCSSRKRLACARLKAMMKARSRCSRTASARLASGMLRGGSGVDERMPRVRTKARHRARQLARLTEASGMLTELLDVAGPNTINGVHPRTAAP